MPNRKHRKIQPVEDSHIKRKVSFTWITFERLKASLIEKYGSERRVMSLTVDQAVREYLDREETNLA